MVREGLLEVRMFLLSFAFWQHIFYFLERSATAVVETFLANSKQISETP